jgi:hypothetical protein
MGFPEFRRQVRIPVHGTLGDGWKIKGKQQKPREILFRRNLFDFGFYYRGIRYLFGHLLDFSPNAAKRFSSTKEEAK